MELKFVISSLLLAVIILIPIAKKVEIRKKVAIVGTLVIGTLTGTATILLNLLVKGIEYPLLVELGFLILFTGIIGLYRFYRDPERIPPKAEKVIFAPADGFIRYIKRIQNPNPQSQPLNSEVLSINDGWLIGITITYLDVHVNRSPIDGRVILVKHIPGKFLSLKKAEAIDENRRTMVVIDHGDFKIGLSLIASRMVRKILLWIRENEEVTAGHRIGKIVFGSQTDVIIPDLPGLKINVKEGEQVYAGLTIVAEYQ